MVTIDGEEVEGMKLRGIESWEKLRESILSGLPSGSNVNSVNERLDELKPTYMSGYLSGWRDGIDTYHRVLNSAGQSG